MAKPTKPTTITLENGTKIPMPEDKRGKHLVAHQWPKGVSGNPGGKPKGTRNGLSGDFVNALAEDFERHGPKAIERMRQRDPAAYCKIIAGLLPKQFERVDPLQELSDQELSAQIDYMRSLMKGAAEKLN